MASLWAESATGLCPSSNVGFCSQSIKSRLTGYGPLPVILLCAPNSVIPSFPKNGRKLPSIDRGKDGYQVSFAPKGGR